MGATVSSGFGLKIVILDITTLWNNEIIISQAYIYLETSCVDIMVHKSHKMNAASKKTVSLLRLNNKTKLEKVVFYRYLLIYVNWNRETTFV